jgi:hypothetical protein
MHLPPAAQWRLGRGRAHAALLVLAAAIHLLLLFFLRGQVAAAAWWGLTALALALLLHASWRWWKSPVGVLRWTGREWHWMPAGAMQDVQVCVLRWVLDLQTVALVHAGAATGSGASRWLWLERGAQNAPAWTALRRALLASSASRNSAGQETLRAQTLAFGGTTNFSADYLTGSQTPQIEGRAAAVSAGANGFQDSTLR